MDWKQGITAPKDGTEILAWYPHLGKAVVACYKKKDNYKLDGQKWKIYNGHYQSFYIDLAPTHWMPLPEQPVLAKLGCQ